MKALFCVLTLLLSSPAFAQPQSQPTSQTATQPASQPASQGTAAPVEVK
jgi:hypothetical protein